MAPKSKRAPKSSPGKNKNKAVERESTAVDVQGLNATFLCEVQTAIDTIKAHPMFRDVHSMAPNAAGSNEYMQALVQKKHDCHNNSHVLHDIEPCCFLFTIDGVLPLSIA